ncbi:MAG: hypothetical protein PGN11_11375 [Quadrisphaera sp.]
MVLEGEDGASVELSVVGYQFPDVVAPDGDDWDANWLVIAGHVRTCDGRTWTFRDPGLTTWEVAEVAAWLDRAAAGAISPVPAWTVTDYDAATGDVDGADTDGDDDSPFWWDVLHENGWAVFVEPCLTLGVAAGPGEPTSAAVRLLVGLGAEWAPPPLPERPHAWHCAELRLQPHDLLRAAVELRRELSAFPRR